MMRIFFFNGISKLKHFMIFFLPNLLRKPQKKAENNFSNFFSTLFKILPSFPDSFLSGFSCSLDGNSIFE